MRKKVILFLALLVPLLLVASAITPDFVIDWWTVGPSSTVLSHAATELHGMVGQGIAGQVSQAGTELCSGYLCLPTEPINKIFLSIVLK